MADKTGYIGRNPNDSATAISRQFFTTSGTTTDFTFASGYNPGFLDVYVDGVKRRVADEFTATDGLTFTILQGGVGAGSTVEAVAYKAFNAGSIIGNVTGDLSVSADSSLSGTLDVTGATTLSTLTVTGTTTLGAGTSVGFANTAFNIGGTPDISVDLLSAVDINVSGAATIGGVLTYEDVTNIDSVGIVTARTGVEVTANGLVVNAGVSTFAADVSVADKIVHTGDTNTAIRFPSVDTFTIETAGVERVRVDSSGDVGLVGIATATGLVVVAGSGVYAGHAGVVTAVTFDGNVTGDVTGASSQVTVADESSDTTCFPLFVTGSTGNLPPKSGSNLTFNSSTGELTATSFVGSGEGLTGVASTDNIITGTAATFNNTTELQNVQLVGIITGLSVSGVSTFAGNITAPSFIGNVSGTLDGNVSGNVTGNQSGGSIDATTGAFSGVVTLQNNLDLQDDDKILLGTGDDLEIYHSGSHSFIKDSGTGNLYLNSNKVVIANAADNETLAEFNENGAVELYYDNDMHFATTSDGCKTNGDLSFRGDGDTEQILFDASDASLKFTDNKKAKFGTGDDLEIYHDGTDSIIRTTQGDLYLDTVNGDDIFIRAYDDVNIQVSGDENAVICKGDGSVDLYYNNVKKFETTSGGCDVTGELQCDSLDVDGAGDITGVLTLHNNLDLQDDDKILIGAGDDLEIFHNGTYSFIDQTGTGSLYLRNFTDNQDIIIQADDGSGDPTNYIICDGSDGNVRLYYYGSQKLVTKTDGVDITGELQCDSLDVDGTTSFADDVSFDGASYGARWDKSENQLEIDDNAKIVFGTGTDFEIYVDGSHAYMDLESGIGNLYIRDGSTTKFTFDDNGDFTAAGNVTAYSDISIKENIETIPNALDKVLNLRGVKYDRIDKPESDPARHQIGVVAQEVEKIVPEVVLTHEDGIKSVAYSNLVGLLIESIKELKTEIDALKAK